MENILFDGLLGQVKPEREFAITETEQKYSYQDVLDMSAQFANVLQGLGVKPGDRIAVQVPKSVEALMLYLGTIRAGAVFLPLNTAYTPTEIEYFLEDAKPEIFVVDPDKAAHYEVLTGRLAIQLKTLGNCSGSLFEEMQRAKVEFSNIKRDAGDLAAILYTSGTTGRSKGAMLTHDNLLSNAEVLTQLWRFDSNDVLLHALPIFHIHGLFVAINIVLKAGASMIFLPRFDADQIVEYLPRVTTLMGVPTFYTRLLDNQRFNRQLASHIRLFISGSAPLLAETHELFESRIGHQVLERYGMTETNMNASNPYHGQRRAGTVGLALPGTEILITDPQTGLPLQPGEIGMIEVRGRNVFAGYWQMPEKTNEELRSSGFFITGDLGRFDELGYLQIVGRVKDLIISGGYNIYPKEIELLLDEQEAVLESAVVGIPHPDLGEAVLGIVVAEKGKKPNLETILFSISQKLARFKQPRRLVVVEKLPRNTMGKVQKNNLRDQFDQLFKTN